MLWTLLGDILRSSSAYIECLYERVIFVGLFSNGGSGKSMVAIGNFYELYIV